MKLLVAILFFCALCGGVGAAPTVECKDLYKVEFALRPLGSKYWVLPSDPSSQLALPFAWNAHAGEVQLEVRAKRSSDSRLELEFLHIRPTETTTLTADIDIDDGSKKQFIKVVVDQRTGDVWTLGLTPVCQAI